MSLFFCSCPFMGGVCLSRYIRAGGNAAADFLDIKNDNAGAFLINTGFIKRDNVVKFSFQVIPFNQFPAFRENPVKILSKNVCLKQDALVLAIPVNLITHSSMFFLREYGYYRVDFYAFKQTCEEQCELNA